MTTNLTRALVTGTVDPTVALPLPNLDAVLTGANGGVRCLFDLAFGPCYPGGPYAGRPAPAAPYSGQAIYDMARRANLQGRAPVAGPAPAYAGGGFDFTALTTNDGGVRGPADTWATIFAGAQRFLWVAYVRMPTQAEWWATNSSLRLFSGTNTAYSAGAEGLAVLQIGGQLSAARQTAAAAVDDIRLVPTADHYGKVCQLAFWRTATGQGFRMAPLVAGAGGKIDLSKAVTATGAPGAQCTADFSAGTPQWGVPIPGIGAPMSAGQQTSTNIRLYRGWIEDLAQSGRDPVATIDADIQRVLDRVLASAAGNGGTSQIFV